MIKLENKFENSKVTCTRCNGSGKTEHSHVMDGVCFLCSRFGVISKSEAKEDIKKVQARKQAKNIREAEMVKRCDNAYKAKEAEYFIWQHTKNINYLNTLFNYGFNEVETKVCKSIVNMLNYLLDVEKVQVSKEFLHSKINTFFKDDFFNYKNAILSSLISVYGIENVDVPNNIDLESNESKMHYFTNNIYKNE